MCSVLVRERQKTQTLAFVLLELATPKGLCSPHREAEDERSGLKEVFKLRKGMLEDNENVSLIPTY